MKSRGGNVRWKSRDGLRSKGKAEQTHRDETAKHRQSTGDWSAKTFGASCAISIGKGSRGKLKNAAKKWKEMEKRFVSEVGKAAGVCEIMTTDNELFRWQRWTKQSGNAGGKPD